MGFLSRHLSKEEAELYMSKELVETAHMAYEEMLKHLDAIEPTSRFDRNKIKEEAKFLSSILHDRQLHGAQPGH